MLRAGVRRCRLAAREGNEKLKVKKQNYRFKFKRVFGFDGRGNIG